MSTHVLVYTDQPRHSRPSPFVPFHIPCPPQRSSDLSSHEPLLLLFVELLHPVAGQLQVVVGPMRLVVQVHTGHCLFRDSPLYLRPLVPLVERRDGDDLRPRVERCLQGCLVIAAVHPVARVVVVPRPDAGVDVAGPHTGDEQEVIAVAESLDGLPVLMGGAEGEAVGGKVRVHAIEATGEYVVLVALLHDQRDEDGVIGGAAHAVGAGGSQKL